MKTARLFKACTAALTIILAAASACAGATVYVDADATGANDGTSWQNAFVSLRSAISNAHEDEIRVACGVYKPGAPGDRAAAFELKPRLVIKGGYAGFGEPNPDARDFVKYETILSGDLKGDDAPITDTAELTEDPTRNDNSQHIVTVSGYIQGAEAPVLEGFTISGGNAAYSGGGLMVDYSDLIVKDCLFVKNSAEYNAGAMAFWNSRVIFKRCAFIANAAVKNGGAIHTDGCPTCRGSYLLLENCTFLDNHAWIHGGAISNYSTSVTSLVNCLVAGNYAAGLGGGLYDSGYYGCRLTNCTLVGNAETAVTFAEAKSVMTNCIVWDNRMGTGMNDVHQIHVEQGVPAPDITYCHIQRYVTGPGGLIPVPGFVSPGYWDSDLKWVGGDYHLWAGSVCIDAGDPDYVPGAAPDQVPTGYYHDDFEDLFVESSATDLDGAGRMAGRRVDIGAYEYYLPTLVAHWKLDEAAGDIAEDSAGENDGILKGNPQWLPGAGRVGGALSFDGLGDYVNCGNSSVFDITGRITVAAWVKIRAVNMDWQTVIAKGDSAWRLSTANDEMRYHFAVRGGPPWNYINGDIEVSADEWRHVCGTYDGVNLRLYIDGVEDPAGPVPEPDGMTVDDYDVLIGENQQRSERFWDGMIDDVRVYNYTLTEHEIARLLRQGLIYVDDDAPADPLPGDPAGSDPLEDGSAAHPFDAIQEAIDAARDAEEVVVLDGTYTGRGNRDIGFAGKAITVRSANGPDNCIIDCQSNVEWPKHRGFYFHSDEGRDSVVEGFTITNGVACTGAAIMCTEGASPTIRNNILRGNIAEYDCDGGGGIACRRNAAPLIEGNLIEGNLSMAGQGGGGIHCYEAGDVEIVGNIIAGNIAESPGGGIDIVDDGGLILIANNLIAGNTSSRGGAISCRGAGRAMVVNNTVVGNRATGRYGLLGRTGGIDIDTGLVANCILWGNIDDKGLGEAAQIRAAPHDVEISYNCIRGWTGTLGGIGNMGEDPAFAVPGYWNHNQTPAEPNDDFWIMGDYHLKSQAGRWDPAAAHWVLDTLTSPCIDAGDPLASIGYEVFPNGGIVNIGAYGGTAEAAKSYFGRPPCKKILAGDINGDCSVNFGDFCIIALQWLEDNNP